LILALGVTVAVSDYPFAGLDRAFFAERYPPLAPSSGIAYFDGEWGIRFVRRWSDDNFVQVQA
jgi:hypothetical protein